jgi:hypothetical protein
MAKTEKPAPYVVWNYYDFEGFHPNEANTLKEAREGLRGPEDRITRGFVDVEPKKKKRKVKR